MKIFRHLLLLALVLPQAHSLSVPRRGVTRATIRSAAPTKLKAAAEAAEPVGEGTATIPNEVLYVDFARLALVGLLNFGYFSHTPSDRFGDRLVVTTAISVRQYGPQWRQAYVCYTP